MANPALAKLQRMDDRGAVTKEFLVHASKVRLYKYPQRYDGHRGPLLRPGELADFDESESSMSCPPPPVRGANSAPPSAPDLEDKILREEPCP